MNTTNILFESKTNAITRKLGIPERPKKPLTGYFRFLNEVRPTLESTAKSQKETMALAAAQWKKLDESQKKKYNDLFEKENVRRTIALIDSAWIGFNFKILRFQEVFRKKKEAYEKSLTKEQKLAIKDERIRLKELKEENAKRAERKIRLRELGKPKRPKTSFILYYIDENSKGKTSMQALKVKYAALNDAQKNAYKQKAAALLEDYRWVN